MAGYVRIVSVEFWPYILAVNACSNYLVIT